jgi:hypothetical protein
MTICVNNFCKSGFGDRLIDIFVFSIFAKVVQQPIRIHWVPFQGMEFTDIPKWRFYDTLLTNFLSFFKLPESIRLEDTSSNDGLQFQEYLGGLTSPQGFYDKHLQNTLPLESYNKIVEEVRSEFGLHVPDYMPDVPYIFLHLRRTDKLRGVCETQINLDPEDTLEHLDNKTKMRIEEAKAKGHTHFYIASDSPETKQQYKEFIESLGLVVIQPANTHNLIESYFDSWMMKSASLIMVSTKYSTYSLSTALIYNKPLINVLTDSVYRKYKFEKHVNILQEVPTKESMYVLSSSANLQVS